MSVSERSGVAGNRLRLGVRLPVTGPVATPENLSTVALLAEKLGYESIWCSDHLLSPRDVQPLYPGTTDGHWPFPRDTRWLEPLVTLTWLGALAPSVELGTCVLVLPMRNPIVLAKQVSTLDVLTRGRVVLGVGVGWMEEEFAAVGVSFDDRARRVAESVALMRQLWTGEEIEFDGEFWQVKAAEMHPAPVRKSIPIVWGGMGRPTVRRVAKAGDGWLPTFRTVQELADAIAGLKLECERVERDFSQIRILFKPGIDFDFQGDTMENLLALGVTDYIFDPRPTRLDARSCEEDMLRIAEACDLAPRVSDQRIR
jgi:probable F420-dependent oxidoreductase